MNIGACQPKVRSEPFEATARNPLVPEADKIAYAAQQFEAVLLRQILSAAQKTVFKSDYTSESASGTVYRDLVTEQLADAISRSGSFGFATQLQSQLTRQNLAERKDSE